MNLVYVFATCCHRLLSSQTNFTRKPLKKRSWLKCESYSTESALSAGFSIPGLRAQIQLNNECTKFSEVTWWRLKDRMQFCVRHAVGNTCHARHVQDYQHNNYVLGRTCVMVF